MRRFCTIQAITNSGQRFAPTREAVIATSRFDLGTIVATPGALEALVLAGETLSAFLKRHVSGDWGDLDEHDRAENEISANIGLRILSAYVLADGTRIWIITEADRSSTTILLPEEY